MGYPLFLDFVHLTGLSYNIVLSIIWVVAAILMVRLFSRFDLQPIFLIFIYLFVLFTPCAFDYYVGTRLYRNSIIAPFLFIVFALMLILIVDILKNKDIKYIINDRLREEIKNGDRRNGYNSFLATQVRLILNLIKKEGNEMEDIKKNNDK